MPNKKSVSSLSLAKSENYLVADRRHVIVFNFKVPEKLLLPYLPEGTQIDTFKGECYLSLIGYLSLNTKIAGVPIMLKRDFEGLGLRFYVKRRLGRKVRRGVVYIKEVVPKKVVAASKRKLLNSECDVLPMGHKIDFNCGEVALGGRVEYFWQSGAQKYHVSVLTEGTPKSPSKTSIEHYINDHPYGYATLKDGSSVEYEIKHPNWRVTKVVESSLFCDGANLYSKEIHKILKKEPDAVFLAEGSTLEIGKADFLFEAKKP